MAKELFISYGRETEVIYFVKQLKKDLEDDGFTVWLDCDDISSGSDWHGAIGTALDNCKAVIPVITNKYITSRYCKGELYTADSNKTLIFPIFLEDVDLSATELSRGVKFIIAGINWTFFRSGLEDYRISLTKLIQGMREKGLGSPGEDGTDSAGLVTAQMAQLHLQPSPSAPPPMPMMPMPYQQVPTGYYQPPPPQPYYTTPSPNSTYGIPAPYPQPVYQTSPGHPPGGPAAYPPSTYQTPPSPYQPGTANYPPYQPYPAGYYTSPPTITPPPGHPYQTPPPSTHPQGPYVPPPGVQPPGVPPPGVPPIKTEPPPPYLMYEEPTGEAASVTRPNFKVGMKLEAVDQRFPYFVCVATVMDKSDDNKKLLVHFDGWSTDYNYWCSRDDIELHPTGWCEKHGWDLQPPHGQSWQNWSVYLNSTHSEKAPEDLFCEEQLLGPCSLLFTPGMKIEAKDRANPSQVCVATIADVHPGEVKVHIDGKSSDGDYWCLSSSTDIHPCMWSAKQRKKAVTPPKGHVGVFKWNEYLSHPEKRPAPAHVFNKAQISGSFQIGMRLEAKDRLNESLVAVATVANIKDDQLLIHFDGWTSKYDYWCSCDCVDIHPVGWCGESRRQLQPPKGFSQPFDWSNYLSSIDAIPAPNTLFTEAQKTLESAADETSSDGDDSEPEVFTVGMKLEAKDRRNPTMICVATIVDVRSDCKELLIHFDGWTDAYDYWCQAGSTDIHPVGWCEEHGKILYPPKGDGDEFDWEEYLESTNSDQAPDELFTAGQTANPREFQAGMRLEAKDRMNPSLVCVATITEVKSNAKELLIHFDGWTSKYDYWCKSDSTDIHPVGWCKDNGKALQAPKGYGGSFNWTDYLIKNEFLAAPETLFTPDQCSSSSSSSSSIQFQAGMKLEAKDRLTPSLVCVATITQVKSNAKELLIHFDGWTSKYDYWCKSDSTDIHPVGWCKDNGKALQAPKGHGGTFDWHSYLKYMECSAAPAKLFTEAQKAGMSQFRAGMKLEAKDRLNPSMVCVATINEVKNGKLLIHFDGWSTSYDYWCEPESIDIHPIGWCEEKNHALSAPYGYTGYFKWNRYLEESGNVATPTSLFTAVQK